MDSGEGLKEIVIDVVPENHSSPPYPDLPNSDDGKQDSIKDHANIEVQDQNNPSDTGSPQSPQSPQTLGPVTQLRQNSARNRSHGTIQGPMVFVIGGNKREFFGGRSGSRPVSAPRSKGRGRSASSHRKPPKAEFGSPKGRRSRQQSRNKSRSSKSRKSPSRAPANSEKEIYCLLVPKDVKKALEGKPIVLMRSRTPSRASSKSKSKSGKVKKHA
ncbi:hypothetical protein Aperf_G00000132602 [Anoplocephala perfoliata]